MRNLFGTVFIVLIMIIAAGCTDEAATTENMEGATYTGVIPCADCEGIAYKLSIKKDNRFRTSSVYIGKSNRAFTERGTWKMQGDSLLILNESEETPRQFKIKNNQLIMLDQQGKEISGSLSQMYTLTQADSTATDKRWEEQRKQGVDFRAAGNEPSWSLDIDFDNMMTFSSLNGDSMSTPVPQMKQDTTTKARVWETEVESGSMRVEISPTGCVDDMSGEVFNYHVNVVREDTSFSGCGNFINPKYKLNDFWTLKSIKSTEINSQNSERKIPALQFNLPEEKVYGNTGCNQLNGSISLEDSSLSFTKIVTTKMACPGDTESRFMEALQQVEHYTIANARLLLMNKQDTLLTFERAE